MKTRNFLAVGLVLALQSFAVCGPPSTHEPGIFVDVTNLGPPVNGSASDFQPWISPDGLVLLFTSTRLPSEGGEDLFWARRDAVDALWATPENLGPGVKIPASEAGGSLSANLLTIYFARGFTGGRKLYVAKRRDVDEAFTESQALGGDFSSNFEFAGTYLSVDGLFLYFHSDLGGNLDLYVSRRANTEDEFTEIESLGLGVNTRFEERSPCVSADGLTVFFNSDRGSSWDLYVATRTEEDELFGDVRPLEGRGVNTLAGEFAPVVSLDWPATGSTLYFHSNSRSDGSGQGDLYQATWISFKGCDETAGTLLPDCNANGYSDTCEIDRGASQDVDENGIPDECEDCNSNDLPDLFEVQTGATPDCNENEVPDDCDLAAGMEDLNRNRVPDTCEQRLQLPGDLNQDGGFDLSDAVSLFGFLFGGTPAQLPCGDGTTDAPGNVLLADHNGDDGIDLSDGVAALNWLFGNGTPHTLAVAGQETKACVLIFDCPEADECAQSN